MKTEMTDRRGFFVKLLAVAGVGLVGERTLEYVTRLRTRCPQVYHVPAGTIFTVDPKTLKYRALRCVRVRGTE